MYREAAAYWIVRSSQTMTALKIESEIKNLRRPGLEPGPKPPMLKLVPLQRQSLSDDDSLHYGTNQS
jgi:hypothetical protein